MKTAVVLLGFFVAFAAAEENCPLARELKRGFEECRELMKPSDETMELVAKESGADNRDVQCFQACMMTKAGLMDDLKFDIEKMESLLRSAEKPDDDLIKSMVQVMSECKEEAEGSATDECEVAGNYMKCAYAKRDAAKSGQ